MKHKLKIGSTYELKNAGIDFLCPNCERKVRAHYVIQNEYSSEFGNKRFKDIALICPSCGTINQKDIETGEFLRNPLPLKQTLEKLPEDVERVFSQAKDCYRVGAYDAVTMLLRKLIMHIGVTEGLDEGKSFNYYVGELHKNGLIPPKSKGYIDKIRESGNEINHEITYETKENADDLLRITEVLLLNAYEYADDNTQQ